MPHKQTYDNVIQTVANTPMIRINRLIPAGHATVFAKCEFFNPLNSVKDRIGMAMIEDAEKSGRLTRETHIIEPTSGNTGIALAFVAAAKGYRLTLTMPESMSVERRALLRALGANLILTPAGEGMRGAIAKAGEMVAQDSAGWMPQQFENPSNPAVHERTTGPEIWADTAGQIDAIVAGVGTGGTITGVARYIKKLNPNFKAIAVEPKHSPVISGGQPGKRLSMTLFKSMTKRLLSGDADLPKKKESWRESAAEPTCGQPLKWLLAPSLPANVSLPSCAASANDTSRPRCSATSQINWLFRHFSG
jgi:cysteine synthase